MNFPCTLKIAFLLTYTDAASAFSEALANLHKDSGTMRQAEYDQLYKLTEEAREKADSARVAMERHVSSHGC